MSLLDRLKNIVAHVRQVSAGDHQPVSYGWFSDAEVGAFFAAISSADEVDTIDAQTYSDLNGPSYAGQLLAERSIVARQYFEHGLRCGASGAEADQFGRGVQILAEDAPLRSAIRQAVEPLRQLRQEVAGMLFGAQGPVLPAVFERLRFADVIGLAACVLVLLWPSWPTALTLPLYVGVSLTVQVRCYRALKEWTARRDALQQLVACAQALGGQRVVAADHLFAPVLHDRAGLQMVADRIRTGWLSRMPATAEYANLLLLYEYARACRESRAVLADLPMLREIFQAVGRLELQLAYADATCAGLPLCRAATPADAPAGAGLGVTGLIHPLLTQALPVTMHTRGRSLFISGKNGVGKSTLLRAVGLALASHRAFGLVHAHSATLPRASVWSSIQVSDSIADRRSLYMAESQRAARLLVVAQSATPVVFLVDELFHGTNYVESVSASAAALCTMARRHMVLATSHNLVLATLLQQHFDSVMVCAAEAPQPRAIHVHSGVITQTNGVELLASYGVDPGTIDLARRIADWYADYIEHPAEVPPGLMS